ncbi:fibronectin type III domain-containing protein [Aliidiomarina sp.]|uniref:fibronectin type III domain-containing protein n=1 Tax=Aliidiomarina sp. TaxID=1872439 RepID=UPI003A4E4F50
MFLTTMISSFLLPLAANAAIDNTQSVPQYTHVERNTLVPAGAVRYAPSIFPDRIVLVPAADAATAQGVSWRTDASVAHAVAEIAPALATPGLHYQSLAVQGKTMALSTSNGDAHHHHVTFSDLEPDTLYAYRVRGGSAQEGDAPAQVAWSEWFQFRTPTAEFSPYTAVYFGDAQNAVKSHFSRVIREAFRSAPEAMIMVHAGDLVNSRYGEHDDEWGEWFDAGGWLHGMVNQFAAPGNHEYIEHESGPRTIVPQWAAHFGVPKNGPEPLQSSVYYTDFQGVRYIALDSMQALQSEEYAILQADWLREVLRNNPNQWTIVSHHHPMFSVSLGRDNPPLRQHWQPIYEEFGVDLVLQGHDHTYGRGQNITEGTSGQLSAQGPMYVVSVAGPKMYLVTEQAEQQMQATAEELQLFQTLHFTANTLRYQARTVTGELFDAFDLSRDENGNVTVVDRGIDEASPLFMHRCTNPNKPRETRCWNGTEVIQP